MVRAGARRAAAAAAQPPSLRDHALVQSTLTHTASPGATQGCVRPCAWCAMIFSMMFCGGERGRGSADVKPRGVQEEAEPEVSEGRTVKPGHGRARTLSTFDEP